MTSRKPPPFLQRSRGFSLMLAIFIIVALAALSVALVSLSSMSHQQSALDVQGARAYQAARAGIEWGLYQQLRLNAACNGSTQSFNLPAGTSLSGFLVSVTCVQTPAGAITATTRRQLTAVACNQPGGTPAACPNPGPSLDYVQRRMQVEF